MSATPDVVPVAWVDVANRLEGPYDFHGDAYMPRGKHNLYSQATVDALQARIDELETQLFIERAEPALSLFEQLGLPALPAFPSVRGA